MLGAAGALEGILTSSDVAWQLVAEGRAAETMLVREAMTVQPHCVATGESAVDAVATMMAHRLCHLPVLNEAGGVVGLLDIAKCLYDAMAAVERMQAPLLLACGTRCTRPTAAVFGVPTCTCTWHMHMHMTTCACYMHVCACACTWACACACTCACACACACTCCSIPRLPRERNHPNIPLCALCVSAPPPGSHHHSVLAVRSTNVIKAASLTSAVNKEDALSLQKEMISSSKNVKTALTYSDVSGPCAKPARVPLKLQDVWPQSRVR